MGKKSKNPRKAASSQQKQQQPINNNETAAGNGYPSDGPSQEELNRQPTLSPSLQAKLDQLVVLIEGNDRAGFVDQFVPLDLSVEDRQAYLENLTTHPEAESTWRHLAAEIAAIRVGHGVRNVEGDQIHRCAFFFAHPVLHGCDREVAFVCVDGEWRAEG